MKYKKIPHTNLEVSTICLGTMTFGNQNNLNQAMDQMSYAVERGINFFDTAEMYPIGGNQTTFGNTERYIGNWFKKTRKREQIILATKIAGPNRGLDYIRNPLNFTKKSLNEAVELSLKNLQTDYIDLYQLHWPERVMNMFGKSGITNIDTQWQDNFLEILTTCNQLIKEGKIKHLGVSNENPWGIMRYLQLAEQHNLPKIVSIQNPYSLLNRLAEVGLSEICLREQISYLAYSPLAFGMLTGKYKQGIPQNARMGLYPQFTRYTNTQCYAILPQYEQLANELGLTLTQLALAFVHHQPFIFSTIIGASTLDQLEENINAFDILLTDTVLEQINNIHQQQPYPAP